MIYIFWSACTIIFYHLFIYGGLISLIANFKKENDNQVIKKYPTITVLCPAYNEEENIEEKIKSFLNLDYPKEKIRMIVISDESTDNTDNIVKKYKTENVELVIQKPRKGKPSGHNLVEPTIKSEYIVSTDANSIFAEDSILQLIKTIQSDSKIGMVVGQLKLVSKGKDSGEGIYWKFENFLKINESRIHSIICANGSLFLIKRELFTQIHPSSVDDFERTLIVLENKYVAKFNENAIVTEDVTQKPIEEMSRKIRIISREWFALFRHAELLNPITNLKNAFFLISHKIIRWLLPVWSLSILVSSIFLFNSNFFFKVFLVSQICVIISGILEVILEKNNLSLKVFKIPAYILIMNYSSFMALIKVIKGEQQTTWNTDR